MRPLLLLFLMLASLDCRLVRGKGKSDDQTFTLEVSGTTRGYLLHLPPSYDGKSKLPLLLALHGGGGSGDGMGDLYGLNEAADQKGFIVAYPNGSGRLKDRLLTWNAGNCCGYALDNKIDDVAFLSALIDALIKSHKADPKRVYVTGMSNGAMMSYRLACEAADKIAGIAPVEGALNVEPCKPSRPVSLLIFHGRDDQHVLYEGGAPKVKADDHERIDQSVSYAAAFFQKNNGCPTSEANGSPTSVAHSDEVSAVDSANKERSRGASGSQMTKKEEKGDVLFELSEGCKDGSAVGVYSIKNHAHAWPGGKKPREKADTPSQAISASPTMLQFFLDHPKP